MTTPERLRRRQRIETALVIAAIMLSFLSTAVLLNRVSETQDCLSESFSDLTDALNARSEISERNTDSVNHVIIGVASAETSEEFRALLNTFVQEQAQLEKDRKAAPYPPYPSGNCD